MTIQGITNAIELAKERVRRSNESICIVKIGNNEYVLWRENTIDSLIFVYKHYKVLLVIRKQDI